MKVKKAVYPQKRTMNLYYKSDRTTKPATAALYVIFVLVVALGLGKFLVYDLWSEVRNARARLESLETQLAVITEQLENYDEVKNRYQKYSATEEEAAQVDRMEILNMLNDSIGANAQMSSLSISGRSVSVQFSGVTLAQTAEIVRLLEQSPIVERTSVNTASNKEDEGGLVSAGVLIDLKKEGNGK